jgi:methylenetetrahydrofolate reductase (NADPH)
VDNVLVLRGDAPRNEAFFQPESDGHRYAIDLMKQVANMNNGIYLEEDLKGAVKTRFCIGVAGYPEKHFEAPNMNTDLNYLKAKVDAGAEYIITQMFFDNQKYFDFVNRCRDIGVTIPITRSETHHDKKTAYRYSRTFYVDIPNELANEIRNVNR